MLDTCTLLVPRLAAHPDLAPRATAFGPDVDELCVGETHVARRFVVDIERLDRQRRAPDATFALTAWCAR
jgi:hypothetical protein